MSEDGVLKAAILLQTIDIDQRAEVFKLLGPKEAKKVSFAMKNLKNISRDQVADVLREFRAQAEERSVVLAPTDEELRSVLTRALGNDRAASIIDQILHGTENTGIESLKWMDASAVAELIKNEHPQIVATILVHLDHDQSSEVLLHLPERLRNDVLLRISTLEGVQPSALRELNEVLTQLLSGSDKVNKNVLGGPKIAAEILNYMGGAAETSALDTIRDFDASLAQQIQDAMFTFDNLLTLDDRSIQLLLREVSSETLIVALKGTSDQLKDKIFRNMSQRAAEGLREDLESKGPVRISEVEAQQKEILKLVRRLAEEGQIVLGGKGEESIVQ